MRMRSDGWPWVVVCLGTFALAGVVRAGDGSGIQAERQYRKALDQHLAEVLKVVHNRGADLYNNGDVAGCYRLFQGALLTVRPLLDHDVAVQKAIDSGLAEAENNPDMRKRAFGLHRLMEDVRTQVKSAAEGP